MRSKVTYQGQGSSEVKLGGKCWFSLFRSPLKSWKSDWDQTWFMDIKWEPSYVDEVKVTYRGQRSSEVKLEEG